MGDCKHEAFEGDHHCKQCGIYAVKAVVELNAENAKLREMIALHREQKLNANAALRQIIDDAALIRSE